MLETLASHLDAIASVAPVWGLPLVFFFMAVESSFIPFPSEVVMIPAGFLAMRGALSTHCAGLDLVLALVCGTLGSLAGAFVNYYLAKWLGRPFLHRWGKWFFLKEPLLDRAEEIFRTYGSITTFVCRLIPVVRQLISLPAGMAGMALPRFVFFTTLGAGIWNAILLAVGAWFGHATADMTWLELVTRGKELISSHYLELFLVLGVIIAVHVAVSRLVTRGKKA